VAISDALPLEAAHLVCYIVILGFNQEAIAADVPIAKSHNPRHRSYCNLFKYV